MATLNINNTDNQVTAVNANQSIIVTDNGSTTQTSITVTQPVTSIVLVNALGPVGPSGNGGNINTSSFATTGSNTFIGNQIITGSVYISGSLNTNAQVYEVSFLQKDSPPYPFNDNLIELDQDLITNLNYTRNTNTITVNSSGSYRIYNQCRIRSTVFAGEAELAVFINSNPYRTYYINNIKQNEISTYDFSCIANLNINDTIEFHINSSTEFILDTYSKIYGVINSYMTIEKLN
jgi:hypothetical protein